MEPDPLASISHGLNQRHPDAEHPSAKHKEVMRNTYKLGRELSLRPLQPHKRAHPSVIRVKNEEAMPVSVVSVLADFQGDKVPDHSRESQRAAVRHDYKGVVHGGNHAGHVW